MADFTPAQRAAMGALLAGTFDKLDTSPRMQPAYSVDEIYKGIIPASGSAHGSAEANANALVSRKVQTMRVDGNGQPVMGPTGSATLTPSQGTLQANAAVNAINAVAPHASGTLVNDKLAYRAGEGGGQPYLPTFGNYMAQPVLQPQPVQVTVRGGNNSALLRAGRNIAGAPLFLQGDPGETDWSIANPGATGLFGVAAQGRMAQPNRYRAPAPQQQLPVVSKQAVIAAQPAPNVTNNISRFLSEQGVDDKNMSAGQQADALKKAMGLY